MVYGAQIGKSLPPPGWHKSRLVEFGEWQSQSNPSKGGIRAVLKIIDCDCSQEATLLDKREFDLGGPLALLIAAARGKPIDVEHENADQVLDEALNREVMVKIAHKRRGIMTFLQVVDIAAVGELEGTSAAGQDLDRFEDPNG